MPKPVLQSLILADHVYEDKLTGKRIIAGIFNRIIRGVRVYKDAPAPAQPPPGIHIPNMSENAAPLIVQSGQAVPPAFDQPGQPAYAPSGQGEQPERPAGQVAPAAQAAPPRQASAPQPSHPHQAAFTPPPLQPGQRMLEIPPTGLQSGSPFAYLSLTEVRGVTPFVLQLVSLEDDTQLFRSDLRVECQNPLYTIELTVPLPPIAPPRAGIYALELLHNNEILGSLRIVVEDAA
jgi:hypothetical protein